MKLLLYRTAWAVARPFLILFGKLLGVPQLYQQALCPLENLPADVRYCLVPGALLHRNDSLSPILKERLDAAIRLHAQRPEMIFVLSGDGSKRVSNDVKVMHQYLKEHSDIPETQLITDDQGYTTLDSVRFMQALKPEQGFALLTTAFHQPRMAYICHALKQTVYILPLSGYSSRYQADQRDRELAAVVKTWYLLHFGKPAFGRGIHRFWFYVILICSKITRYPFRLVNKDSLKYPGKLALRFCPYLFEYLTKHPALTVTVGGPGARRYYEIATDLVARCKLSGNYREQQLTLECAAEDFLLLAPHLTASDITIQIIRLSVNTADTSDIDSAYLYNSVLSGIDMLPRAVLCLNTADPLVASIAGEVSNQVKAFTP